MNGMGDVNTVGFSQYLNELFQNTMKSLQSTYKMQVCWVESLCVLLYESLFRDLKSSEMYTGVFVLICHLPVRIQTNDALRNSVFTIVYCVNFFLCVYACMYYVASIWKYGLYKYTIQKNDRIHAIIVKLWSVFIGVPCRHNVKRSIRSLYFWIKF